MDTILHNMFTLVIQATGMDHPLLTIEGVVEKVLRTLVVYLFLVGALRLGGKRELSQLNPFDIVLLLLLSNAVQNAIIGNETSLSGGLIGATTLLVVNYLIVRILYNRVWLDRLIEGKSDLLMSGGRVNKRNMKKNLITMAELERAAQQHGIPSFSEVEKAMIDSSGSLNFIVKEPTPEQKRHQALLDRIDQLEQTIQSMTAAAK